MKTSLKIKAIVLACSAMLGMQSASALPVSADVIAIVDESGSMSGEHAWLGGMMASLDAGIVAQNVGTGSQANQYGLTGFGGGSSHFSPHKHSVGGSEFGTAAEFGTATSGLVLNGATEDGWAGIHYAANNYTFNSNSARNFILVTDEDRDNTNAALTYTNTLAVLTSTNTLLNAVVNCEFRNVTGAQALGIDSAGFAYTADGSGGFTKSAGYTINSNNCSPGGFGSGTQSQYVDLALDSGGAAWDLNLLRAGGLTASSFTNAFVNIKVKEITQQVPAPGTLALLGLGLIGLSWSKRKKATTA